MGGGGGWLGAPLLDIKEEVGFYLFIIIIIRPATVLISKRIENFFPLEGFTLTDREEVELGLNISSLLFAQA